MTPTILIVDDEPQNRKLLEALLGPEGYHTVSVESGEEAMAEVARHPPDLILLDVMMPGMDGYQVAKLLKGSPATSNIPVVMVTARTDHSARLAGLEAGAEDFLTKPIDRAELWLRVRNMLRLARSADLRRFRAAMDATADGIVLVSRASMRFVEVNATACTMLGYPRDGLLQMGPADLGGSTPEQIEAMYDAIIEGRKSRETTESIRRKDGSDLPVEVHRHAQASGTDWIIVAEMRDITERRAAEERLHHLAHYDGLTGLPNRTLFYEALRKILERASDKGWDVAVLLVDLDHFKKVNDALGHARGDELLAQLGDRLTGCVRIRDTVGRLGGDEFGLILAMEAGQGAAVVANKIRDALRVPFDLNGGEVSVTASIGITVYPGDARDADILIKYADTAMYRAKQAGRDTFRFFTSEMNTEMLARLDLERALRRAIPNDEFVLHYQPKVHLGSGRIAGLEALLRWQRPGHGLVSPADFIPVLEETGLIVGVGRWVIATVCEQIGRWIRSPVGPVPVAVNVSGRQLVEGDLCAELIGALHDNQVPAGLLELELTETSLMANTEPTIATLERLKALGVQISIDDFGTGYSSLAYLRRFPLDKLKIDIAFIRDITTNPDDAAIARTIIRLAHSLQLEVIAEGVETAAQLTYLRRHDCDQIQGYYFSRPLPVSELETMLGEAKCLPAPHRADGLPQKTLLIVEDDPDALLLLHALLGQDGYTVLSATSGAEALELLALNEVQVVLCDQRMPTMTGTEFLDRVKDLHPDTLRIILSGYADLESIMEAINRGAIYRFYKKPWEGNAMRENIRDAFRHYGRLHDIALEGGAALAARAELERRNGELECFASLAAHDLRQPLSVIGGFAALLAERSGVQLDDKAQEYIAAICRGADTMDGMVESLLEFAGNGSAASPGTLVDTARVVADVVTDLQSALADGSIVVQGSLPVLPADPAQLARLFQNLIGNALKFRGEDPPRVEVAAERAGDTWTFRVTDNGIGISPGFTDRLFGMLQRERRGTQPGTGMGLAICRKIVEYHRGRIWLDIDAAPPGSTFRFTLPAGDPSVGRRFR